MDVKFQYSFQNSSHPVCGQRPTWANVTKNNDQVVRGLLCTRHNSILQRIIPGYASGRHRVFVAGQCTEAKSVQRLQLYITRGNSLHVSAQVCCTCLRADTSRIIPTLTFSGKTQPVFPEHCYRIMIVRLAEHLWLSNYSDTLY